MGVYIYHYNIEIYIYIFNIFPCSEGLILPLVSD